MKKYLTKNNILQMLLLVQFILLQLPNHFNFDSQIVSIISFAGLIIGYVINVKKKEV